jgi:hypothetical protein
MVMPSIVVAAFPPLPAFVVLYGLVPLLTISVYVLLCRSASVRSGPPALFICLFPLVFCWGAVLFVGFAALSGHWFGLASIAVFFLLLISPLILLPVMLVLWPIARLLRAARLALYTCFGYYLVIAAGWIFFVRPWENR